MTAPPATDAALAQQFKLAMRRVAATVTILSTADEAGLPHGMAATAVSSVTMDPPTLLACVNRSASLHAPLLQRRRFCVNVLATRHEALVAAFSGRLSGQERFAVGDWAFDAATGLPYLKDAQCNLFCEVQEVMPVGTHAVVLARVGAAWSHDSVAPLLYVDGALTAAAA